MEAWVGGVYFIYLFINLWELFMGIYLFMGGGDYFYLFIGVITLFIYGRG